MIVTHTDTVPDTVSEDEAALRRQIGKRIRVERIWRDLSQDQLATQAGITRNFVSAIERGAQGLDGYRLLRLADVLGLTMTDLFGATGSPFIPGRAEHPHHDTTAQNSKETNHAPTG